MAGVGDRENDVVRKKKKKTKVATAGLKSTLTHKRGEPRQMTSVTPEMEDIPDISIQSGTLCD